MPLQVFYVINASYNVSTTLIKISLLFQYLRVFRDGKMRVICITMLVLTGLWGGAYSFMAWVPCFPVRGYWTWSVGAKCYGFGSTKADEVFAVWVSHTAVNAVLDMVVFLIPMPLYFERGTTRRTKVGLAGLLVLGSVVIGLSMWRLATIVENKASTSPAFDPTWYTPISIVLGVLEVTIASICASVPIFWPSLRARLDEIFITREITVTRGRRSSRFSAVDCGNAVELQHGAGESSRNTESKWLRCSSRAGSETSRSRLAEIRPAEKKTRHYMGDFIQDQVDPLRKKGPFVVESEIVSGGAKGPKLGGLSRS
ncbi:hypothetical protein GGS23DRAFT_578065, partial [Durotheca rogersii]|uniref:uncharacterized protein n=1 Tax=Durotheca rogersii TaxID=419775 RepID=UPI00221E8C05